MCHHWEINLPVGKTPVKSIMSGYALSIGEPEDPQDVPLRITSPPGKGKMNLGTRPGRTMRAKSKMLYQCQALSQASVKSRVFEDRFDPSYNGADEDPDHISDVFIEMTKDLVNEEEYVREAKKDNDESLLLLQELNERSKAGRQPHNHDNAEAKAFATAFNSQQSKYVTISRPNCNDHQNDLFVHECTRMH